MEPEEEKLDWEEDIKRKKREWTKKELKKNNFKALQSNQKSTNTFKDRYGNRITMTVKEEQKEEEDYYLPSPQYRPNSPYPEVTTTLVPVWQTLQETAQEITPEKKARRKSENGTWQFRYGLRNRLLFRWHNGLLKITVFV